MVRDMTTAARRYACAASIAVVIAATGLGPSQAAPVNPTSFPPGVGINANAYTLQFSGAPLKLRLGGVFR